MCHNGSAHFKALKIAENSQIAPSLREKNHKKELSKILARFEVPA
jgi:hypothetical protein